MNGYQVEAQKLTKIITLLQRDQEKYGIEATQAHAKYYQKMEEVKMKNQVIQDLQKKSSEIEAKLKVKSLISINKRSTKWFEVTETCTPNNCWKVRRKFKA